MLEDILKELFIETSNGKIVFETASSNWIYQSKFLINKCGDDCVSIRINDMKLFKDCIKKYLDLAYEFYYDDKEYFELNDRNYVKKLIYDLLINGDHFDYENIYDYVDKKTEMLNTKNIDTASKYIGKYMGYDASYTIKKNRSSLEAPYQFIVTFKDELGNAFELPQITFAIASNKAYLMCIQNKNKDDNVVVKKLDRYFRKVNKDINPQDDIARVSPRSLVSLTLFNAYLKSIGISELEVHSYFPLRYETKVRMIKQKSNSSEEKLDLIDRDQYNMTNRLMYTLKRYAYHFDLSECEFDDIRQRMNLHIDNTKSTSENIIFEINDILKFKKR